MDADIFIPHSDSPIAVPNNKKLGKKDSPLSISKQNSSSKKKQEMRGRTLNDSSDRKKKHQEKKAKKCNGPVLIIKREFIHRQRSPHIESE